VDELAPLKALGLGDRQAYLATVRPLCLMSDRWELRAGAGG